MAIPNGTTGYGNNSTARNVFGLNVKQDLSSVVKYYCYDNDQTFPTLESPALTTATNDVLAGTTTSGNLSMVGLVDTSNAAPSSAWMPSAETGGSANPNLMNGATSYVTQAGSIATAAAAGSYDSNPQITFNMCVSVPDDATTGSTMGFEVQIVYTYTGTDPVPKFQYNDDLAGTEGTPTWIDITPGTHGILHCRSGATVGSLYANIPASGEEETVEGWVSAAV